MNSNWNKKSKFLTSEGESETDTSSSDESSDSEAYLNRVLSSIRHNARIDNLSRQMSESDESDSSIGSTMTDAGYETQESISSISSLPLTSDSEEEPDSEGPIEIISRKQVFNERLI